MMNMADSAILHELMPPNRLIPDDLSSPESGFDFADLLTFESLQLQPYNEGQRPIREWDGDDILKWMIQVALKFSADYSDFCGENYVNMTGADLIRMSETEFEAKSPGYGKLLHSSLVMENLKCGSSSSSSSSSNSMVSRDYTEQDGRSYLNLDGVPENPYKQHGNESDSENSGPACTESPKQAMGVEPPAEPPKKKRGRPKGPSKPGKKKPQPFGRLWEFLRELLRKPESCPSLIKWEDHKKGEFRFVKSDKVAKIWGTRNGNREMNYEKLSRAMRYYYKSDVLQPVYGRRLVYRFGPGATNWRVPDPNFEKQRSML